MINELNVLAATALGAFFLLSVVMVGLAGQIVDFLESHRFLPMTLSYLVMVVAFLSSGSRDPSAYHWFEKMYVALVAVFMLLMAWTPFQDLMASYDPFAAIVALVLMCVATAILAR